MAADIFLEFQRFARFDVLVNIFQKIFSKVFTPVKNLGGGGIPLVGKY